MTETLQRTPDPELMDSPDQVDAYASADFADSNQWFVDELARNLDREGLAAGRLIDIGYCESVSDRHWMVSGRIAPA